MAEVAKSINEFSDLFSFVRTDNLAYQVLVHSLSYYQTFIHVWTIEEVILIVNVSEWDWLLSGVVDKYTGMEIRTFHCVGHFCEDDIRITLRGVSGLVKAGGIAAIFYLTSRPLHIKIERWIPLFLVIFFKEIFNFNINTSLPYTFYREEIIYLKSLAVFSCCLTFYQFFCQQFCKSCRTSQMSNSYFHPWVWVGVDEENWGI